MMTSQSSGTVGLKIIDSGLKQWIGNVWVVSVVAVEYELVVLNWDRIAPVDIVSDTARLRALESEGNAKAIEAILIKLRWRKTSTKSIAKPLNTLL